MRAAVGALLADVYIVARLIIEHDIAKNVSVESSVIDSALFNPQMTHASAGDSGDDIVVNAYIIG